RPRRLPLREGRDRKRRERGRALHAERARAQNRRRSRQARRGGTLHLGRAWAAPGLQGGAGARGKGGLMALQLIKLCVGVDDLEELETRRAERRRTEKRLFVHTRNTPKRREELLAGGSLFWVIRSQIR